MSVLALPLEMCEHDVFAAGLPCHFVDPDLFFADAPAEVELAKSLCVGCPLRAECLAGALERAEPHGVWGGELFVEGVVVPRKRPRGRPPKQPRPAEPLPPAVATLSQRPSPFRAA